MKVKIREILDDCITDGLRSGYQRAYKYEDFPCEENLIAHMEEHIWAEIDRHFDFERNVCNEVVEGFGQLEKEREWVGLTWDEMESIIEHFHTPMLPSQLCRAIEAKLKELNT